MTFEEKKQYLKERGYSLTVQRLAVLEYLHENPIHPSVDRIYKDLQRKYPAFSRATVYNTVQLLTELGLVQPLSVDKERVRYDGNPSPHPHFVCRVCGGVWDIEPEDLSWRSEEVERVLNASVENVEVIYHGLCERCKEDSEGGAR